MIKNFSTGCIKSKIDKRDILLSQIQRPIPLRELPDSYIIPYQLTILDQNDTPSCVGFSTASLKAEKERREQNLIDFDGLWLYQECKKIDGMPKEKGTYLRAAMKVLKDRGAKPLNQSEKSASKYKIGGYTKVDDIGFEGLKSAIYQNGVILSGLSGDNAGWQTAYIRPPVNIQWGHAVALIGFNKNHIIFQNSWGENWGEKGIGYIPKDYLPFDAWAILVDLPDQDFRLVERPKYCFQKDLEKEMHGKDVIMLQKILKYEGCFPFMIKETGYYGIITEQAVKSYQLAYNISSIGKCDSKTRASLNSKFCSLTKPFGKYTLE